MAERGAGNPTQDERVMAALAHGSIFLSFWGLIAAIVIWMTQREKSRYVRFQALQATAYHFVYIALSIPLGMIVAIVMFGIFAAFPFMLGDLQALETADPFTAMGWFNLPFLGMMCIAWPLWLAYVAYGVVGAIQCLRGNDFRYVLIGRWLDDHAND